MKKSDLEELISRTSSPRELKITPSKEALICMNCQKKEPRCGTCRYYHREKEKQKSE